jgi:hypothetical protein
MSEEITNTSVCEITDGDSEGEMTTQDYLEALLRRNKIPRTREKKNKLGDQSLVQLPHTKKTETKSATSLSKLNKVKEVEKAGPQEEVAQSSPEGFKEFLADDVAQELVE